MFDLSRAQLIRYGAVLAAALVIGVIYLRSHPDAGVKESHAKSEPEPAPIAVKDTSNEKVVVHVAGGVRRPGVYRLRAGSRVTNAIEKAGGTVGRADLSALNLAAKVEDGRQIVVPLREVTGEGGDSGVGASRVGAGASGVEDGSGVATSPGSGSGGGAGGGGGVRSLINLNLATLEQLEQLDGVGPATARKIFEYRQEHGGFSRVEELTQIPGIGEKRLASLREQVTM